MAERRATVGSKVGLHARPAAIIARAAAALPVTVTIATSEVAPVDAASVLNLMTLGAMHGDEVVLSAEGEGAEAALAELAALISSELD